MRRSEGGAGAMPRPRGPSWPGPVAVIAGAQLFGTSLWFSANSASDGLARAWGATPSDIGLLTGAVQGGFILGTLALALGGLADRFPASRIFVAASVAGAAFNAGFAWIAADVATGAVLRLLVGLSLAGIYPIGMKLIVGWAPARTGQALALLVAMLTLGTALPHLLQWSGGDLPWQWVVTASSLLALVGAGLIAALGDGPHRRARPASAGPRPSVLRAFRIAPFRAAAIGYFGHMWELYAFWTLVPLLAGATGLAHRHPALRASGLAFAVIGAGALGCVIGGRLSQAPGSRAVALGALAMSGACALVFALFWHSLQPAPLLGLLLVWGACVVADSPQFSALSARSCPQDIVGGALAIQNAIGFAITVVAIAVTTALFDRMGPAVAWLLVPGPVLGLAGHRLAGRPRR